MTRVLHVIPSLSRRTGGPAISLVEAALALRNHGIESTIVTTDMAASVTATAHRPVRLEDLPEGSESLDIRIVPAIPPRRMAFAPALYRMLDREISAHSVVHIHMLWLFPHYAAFRLAQRERLPFIVSPCGSFDPYKRSRTRIAKTVTSALWQRRMLDTAARIQYKSYGELQSARRYGFHAPELVIPNGVWSSNFESRTGGKDFRRQYLGEGSGRLVLTVGRLSHTKGLDVLIRAFAPIGRRRRADQLVIAGPDDEGLTAVLRELARIEGVGSQVHFPGSLNRKQKLAALAGADVWASASHVENFGTALIEALAAGCAVVVSSSINLAADIRSAEAAIVADASPESFGLALDSLLEDDLLQTRLSGRARSYARQFDWSRVAAQLAELYRDVASSTNNSPSRFLTDIDTSLA